MITDVWVLGACCGLLQQTCMAYYNDKAFPVGGSRVKPDFKEVSARLDTRGNQICATKSFTSR